MTTEWMANGLCAEKHPSIFFPSDGVGVEKARKICNECPMQTPCLEYALRNRIDHGAQRLHKRHRVWVIGGGSGQPRRRVQPPPPTRAATPRRRRRRAR